jgi:hypothetical protein
MKYQVIEDENGQKHEEIIFHGNFKEGMPVGEKVAGWRFHVLPSGTPTS